MSRILNIRNASQVSGTWAGTELLASEVVTVEPSKESVWASSGKVITDIGSGTLVVSNGTNDITDISQAIDYLKGTATQEVSITGQETFSQPFASKVLPDGRKLFRRKHGAFVTIPATANNELALEIPYAAVKFNKIEIIGGKEGDYIDLLVYDSVAGVVQQAMGVPAGSVTPNLLLNQFGFNVCVSTGVYEDESSYDADLYAGMKISLIYYNTTASETTVGVNWTLHELVA